MKNKLFLLNFIFLFVTLIICCNSNKFSVQELITNTDSLIVSEIDKRKIILIGESPHSNVIPYSNLVEVLYYWLGSKNKSISSVTLNLILERDPNSTKVINYFIKTGNSDTLYNSFSKYFEFTDLETLNFYFQLRKFNEIVDSLNKFQNNRINFNVFGFEDIYFLDSNFLKKDKKYSELYFINERDKNTADKIIKFIDNSDTNNYYVIFYGNAHLQNGYVDKNFGFDDLDDDMKKGYYLSHYLKNEFGDDNVVTFNRIMMDTKLYNNNLPLNAKLPVAIPSQKFTMKNINPERFDFIIIDSLYDIPSHKIGLIFSKFIIDKYSEGVEFCEKLLPGYKAENILYNLLSDIYFITGNKFRSSKELNLWIKENPNYDGFVRLTSVEFKKQLFNIYKDSYNNSEAKYLLRQFGFLEEDLHSQNLNYNEWQQKIWNNIYRRIIFLNSIGIYWIGYPYEKIKAKLNIEEYSGAKSNDPDFYYQLYIKEYYNFNFSR